MENKERTMIDTYLETGKFYEVASKDGTAKTFPIPKDAKLEMVCMDGNYFFNGVADKVYHYVAKDFRTGKTFDKYIPENAERLILPENAELISVIKEEKDGKVFYHKNAEFVKAYTFNITLKDKKVQPKVVKEEDVYEARTVSIYANPDGKKIFESELLKQ